MGTNAFHVELCGGPADGMRVARDTMPGEVLNLEVRPDAAADPSSGELTSMYELARSRWDVDGQGFPAVHLVYEYVGTSVQPKRLRLSRAVTSLLDATGLPRWPMHLRATRRRFWQWFLAPIDYPFSTRAATHHQSEFPSQSHERPIHEKD